MRVEYVLQDKAFTSLRTFLKRGGKAGDIEMMSIEAIPGTNQSPLNIIKFIIDSGSVDDYGKPVLEKQIIVDNIYEKRSDKMFGIFPYNLDSNITLTGPTIQYEFYHTPSVEQYFKEKYYDDMLGMLHKLGGLDKEHRDEQEIMFAMIKGIIKK